MMKQLYVQFECVVGCEFVFVLIVLHNNKCYIFRQLIYEVFWEKISSFIYVNYLQILTKWGGSKDNGIV